MRGVPEPRTATPLPLGPTYAAAWETYRASFARVVGISLLVFVPATAINAAARHFSEDLDGPTNGAIALAIAVTLVTSIASTLGSSFYAGVVDYTVHAHRHGTEHVPLGTVLRTLPYWRMFAVSTVAAAITAVGFILFIVPGLIALTLLSIAGPLLVMERLTVRGALRRSARLTRRHFWRVVVVIVLPVFLENTLVDAVSTYVGHTLLAETLIHGGLASVIYAYVMLVEVHAAHWLSDEDHALLRNS